jgi:hypothetical protein
MIVDLEKGLSIRNFRYRMVADLGMALEIHSRESEVRVPVVYCHEFLLDWVLELEIPICYPVFEALRAFELLHQGQHKL